MDKEFPCVENTIDLILDPYTIRLWIAQPELYPHATFDYERELVQKIRKHFWDNVLSRNDLLRYLTKLENVNAVQVLDKDGSARYGTVIYTVDFANDVHG